MSLTRHQTITVIPMVKVKNKYGTYDLERGEPIDIDGVSVQPFAGGTVGNLESPDGTTVRDQYTVRGSLDNGGWPGGVKSIVIFEGEEFDQDGKPKIHKIGVNTQHFQVRIKARGAEVK